MCKHLWTYSLICAVTLDKSLLIDVSQYLYKICDSDVEVSPNCSSKLRDWC